MMIYKHTLWMLGCASLLLLNTLGGLRAQNNIPASKPFLNAVVDAQNVALGGAAAATRPNAFAIYNNPSRPLLSETRLALGFSYSPWRPALSRDMQLFSTAAYYKLSERHLLLAGYRYLSAPAPLADGALPALSRPYDYSIDLGYGFQLLEQLSFALSGTYAHSQIATDLRSRDLCLGLAATYQQELSDYTSWVSAMRLSNIGLKNLDKASQRAMLPTSYCWGNALNLILTPEQLLSTSIDLIAYKRPAANASRYSAVSALALEYALKQMIFLRTAYRLAFQPKETGDYSYLSCGLGLKYKFASIDAAYLFSEKNTPMHGTWWLTASFSL